MSCEYAIAHPGTIDCFAELVARSEMREGISLGHSRPREIRLCARGLLEYGPVAIPDEIVISSGTTAEQRGGF